MTMSLYRPWGLLHWVLERCPDVEWSLFGCLGTEERSLAALSITNSVGCLASKRLLRISDNSFGQYLKLREERLLARKNEFEKMGATESDIEEYSLTKASHHDILTEIEEFIRDSGPNIILDVTSLPQRFFFPILKTLLLSEAHTVRNLVVTYAVPESYAPGRLTRNFNDWGTLPLFLGSYTQKPPEMMIVGVGFEALGLQDRVDTGEAGLHLNLLLPFPAPPPAFKRSWELARKLQKGRRPGSVTTYRTDAKEVSDAFERILTLTDSGKHGAILAPFGPKPISVAMCIYATLTESPVFYTQPTVYHPDYSTGISEVNGQLEVYAYCLRINGKDFYRLPNG